MEAQGRLPCLTTPPHQPAWTILGLRPLPRTSERRLGILHTYGGLKSPPQADPKLRILHLHPPGGRSPAALARREQKLQEALSRAEEDVARIREHLAEVRERRAALSPPPAAGELAAGEAGPSSSEDGAGVGRRPSSEASGGSPEGGGPSLAPSGSCAHRLRDALSKAHVREVLAARALGSAACELLVAWHGSSAKPSWQLLSELQRQNAGFEGGEAWAAFQERLARLPPGTRSFGASEA